MMESHHRGMNMLCQISLKFLTLIALFTQTSITAQPQVDPAQTEQHLTAKQSSAIDSPFIHFDSPQWSGEFAVKIERKPDSEFTTLRLIGSMSHPQINDLQNNAETWSAEITLVYKRDRFQTRYTNDLVAVTVNDHHKPVLLKTETIAPMAAIWSVPTRPELPTIEIWNTEIEGLAMSQIDIIVLFQYMSAVPLFENIQLECTPTLDACEGSADRMCPDGIDDFKYSCNEETGTATCEYHCKTDAGDPEPGPE